MQILKRHRDVEREFERSCINYGIMKVKAIVTVYELDLPILTVMLLSNVDFCSHQ